MHALGPIITLSAPLADGRDAHLVAELEHDVPVDADQPMELLADATIVLDGDQQRARQLRGTGEKLVVDRELFPDPIEVRDPLHPEHLLHLIPDRRAILEEKRHAVTDRHPPRPLVGDDAAANHVAMARISLTAEDILERDRAHHGSDPSALPS